MKKILISFDDSHYSNGAFEFARRLNEQEPILLTAVFLPQVDFTSAFTYASGGASTLIPIIESYDDKVITEQVQIFEDACVRNHIEFRVHKAHNDFAIDEIRKETRFADLFIIGSEKFYNNLGTDTPNDYLRMALHESECPVILAPEEFSFPESNVLSYDGSDHSVFAIKSFSSLFPELCSNKTILIYATASSQNKVPDIDYITELAARHFPDLTIDKLHADPKKYFETWLMDVKNPILVCGSFARSGISQAFKHSFVTEVINDHRIPVFITHR